MFSKAASQTLVTTRKRQIRARIEALLQTDNISSREDLVKAGLCTDRYLQEHPELLTYLRTTTLKLVEAKYQMKLSLEELAKPGYFATKSISKQLLYTLRYRKIVELLKTQPTPSVKSVARQIPCTPSYLRTSGLAALLITSR